MSDQDKQMLANLVKLQAQMKFLIGLCQPSISWQKKKKKVRSIDDKTKQLLELRKKFEAPIREVLRLKWADGWISHCTGGRDPEES